MRRILKGPAGDGISGLNGRRVQDGREDTPTLALIEDSPVFAAEKLSVRYSPHDWTTIWGAAALGQTRILAALLSRGENVDRKDSETRTPLIYAADFSQTSSLCLLLEHGANPNLADSMGNSPLFFIKHPQAETLITILVNGGGNPNAKNRYGHSPLFLARIQGNKRLAVLLKRFGAEIGFLEAVASGDVEGARGLFLEGDLDAILPDGETLLLRAVRQGDFSLTALLLEKGANPNRADGTGQTPLDIAAARSRGRLLRLLLDAGANPNLAQSVDNSTLWGWAALDPLTPWRTGLLLSNQGEGEG